MFLIAALHSGKNEVKVFCNIVIVIGGADNLLLALDGDKFLRFAAFNFSFSVV